jgi:hypothetical protein
VARPGHGAREGPECRQAERGLDSLASASVNVLFVFVPTRAERGAIKSDRNTLLASILGRIFSGEAVFPASENALSMTTAPAPVNHV